MLDGFAIAINEIPAHLAEADIIIASTASQVPILQQSQVEQALKKRKHRPMLIVDIAVPRDVAPDVAELDDVYLYTVDDLQEVIQDNMQSRQQAAEQALEIIEQQVSEYNNWLRSLDAVSLIHSFRSQAEKERDAILERALNQLGNGKDTEEVLQFLAHTLTNRLLHTPSAQMREASTSGQTELLEAANKLFQLKG